MSRDDFKEDDFDDSEEELDFEVDDKTDDLFSDTPEPDYEHPPERYDSGREADRKADAYFAERLGYR